MSILILLRHGQSIWNLENRFKGEEDIDLSFQGETEARRAAMLLKNYRTEPSLSQALRLSALGR